MSQGKVLHNDVKFYHTSTYDLRAYINTAIDFFFFFFTTLQHFLFFKISLPFDVGFFPPKLTRRLSPTTLHWGVLVKETKGFLYRSTANQLLFYWVTHLFFQLSAFWTWHKLKRMIHEFKSTVNHVLPNIIYTENLKEQLIKSNLQNC